MCIVTFDQLGLNASFPNKLIHFYKKVQPQITITYKYIYINPVKQQMNENLNLKWYLQP